MLLNPSQWRRLLLMLVAGASGVLAVLWPQWRADLQAQGYGYGPALDHYYCYQVTSTDFKAGHVLVEDQFGKRLVEVIRPTLLCNPAIKNDLEPRTDLVFPDDLQNAEDHLVCYTTKDDQKSRGRLTVLVENQFGSEVLKVRKGRLLCLPSSKKVLGGERHPTHHDADE